MLSVSDLEKAFEYKAGELHWRVSAGRARAGSIAGCVRKDGYVVVRFKGQTLYAHRVIYALMNGVFPDSVIDHIDGNTRNNCITNLRLCSQAQNVRNQKLRKDNTTGAKGVYKKNHTRRWQAQLMVNGKHTHIGYYDTKEEAEEAVRTRRTAEFKEFARHE